MVEVFLFDENAPRQSVLHYVTLSGEDYVASSDQHAPGRLNRTDSHKTACSSGLVPIAISFVRLVGSVLCVTADKRL